MQPTRRNSKHRQRGVALVEFTLSLTLLVPLLIGTFAFGFRLVQAQQMFQITRDLAHMYSRGVAFTTTGAVSEVQDLSGQFSLTSSGNSAVVLSTIQIETSAACKSATGSTNCANLNQPVYVQQIVIGNATSFASPFGTPVSSGTLPATTGVSNEYSVTVSATAQATSSWAVANNFNSVLALSAGDITYMAEMLTNTGLTVTGVTGSPQVYARAIF